MSVTKSEKAKFAPSAAARWDSCPGRKETPELCQCGRPRRPDCDGDGWLYNGSPYSGGVAIGACPND